MNKRIKKKLEQRNGFMKYKNQHSLVTKRRYCPIMKKWFNYKGMPLVFFKNFDQKIKEVKYPQLVGRGRRRQPSKPIMVILDELANMPEETQ